MPRYKVLGACVCERNHANLHTERLVAASAQEAQAVFKGLVTQHNKCTTCGGKMQLGKLLGTEEVPMHPLYVVYGYKCHCGERVEIGRVEEGTTFHPPESLMLSCSQGHSRLWSGHEGLTLEHWMEKTH